MTKFCFDCGNKLEYKFNPPNFCPNCGSNISGLKSEKGGSIPTKETAPASSEVSEDSEGYTNANSIPRISKLEYEIEDFGADIQHTIGSIGGKSAPAKRKNNVKSLNDL
tara:strand:+ start:1137 stop:1463 length:327 start_codon:yes stop_codon:yes gene_type:complete